MAKTTPPPKSDWWEYRSRCRLCGWDGPDTEITECKLMGGYKEFGICPGCNNHIGKRELLLRSRRTGHPIYSHTSCLSGRAVHKECGKWHQPGTTCPVKSD